MTAAPFYKPSVPSKRDRVQMPPRVAAIVTEVASMHDLTFGEIMSDRRTNRIALARFEAFTAIRALIKSSGKPVFSLPAIGRFWGMDHTSVLHGLRRHAEILAEREAEGAAS